MTNTPKRYFYCSKSHKGLVRGNNEDSYLELPYANLWAVADGMGGHAHGEIASSIVVDTLKTLFNASSTSLHSLEEALLESHVQIGKAIQEGHGSNGMGSTAVALKCNADSYQIAWVGDSRAYRWTARAQALGGELVQLTTDHSYVQALVNQHIISPEEAATHPERHIITQCLGAHGNDIQVDQITHSWQGNEWLLLCSDGLTNELSDQQIANILAQTDNIESAATMLLEAALAAGGRDNITLQIIAPSAKPSRLNWLQQFIRTLLKRG